MSHRARVMLAFVVLAVPSCSAVWPFAKPADPADSKTREIASLGVHAKAARAAFCAGDYELANDEARLALQENPRDASSHFVFGCLLAHEGETNQAIVAFERAAALDPSNAQALYNLGTLLLLRDEAVPASRVLETAAAIRPDHVPSYNNLAKAYFRAGLPELAIACYEEVLRQDPTNRIALENLRVMAEAAGQHDAATAYKRRLDAIESGDADVAANDARVPTWPHTTVASASPAPASLPLDPPPASAPTADAEADALRELLRDLPHVAVERRGGLLTLTGWTKGAKEHEMKARILATMPQVLDLTGEDTGDPQRMIEVDAVLFLVTTGPDIESRGFDFLQLINLNFNYFALDNANPGTGFAAPPTVAGSVSGLSQQGWIFNASADYSVNIANTRRSHVTVLCQPHLTTLSGTPARFFSGIEIVFSVSGLNSGDIKPYESGVLLSITPTLLRDLSADKSPRINVVVEATRQSALGLIGKTAAEPLPFEKISVTSQAVLDNGRTLILSGLTQREARSVASGTPWLMDIPILKYFFGNETDTLASSSVIILLTPRDPAFLGAAYRKSVDEFVEKRRAFLDALKGTDEDKRRFRERYPEPTGLPPNRFSSHVYMLSHADLSLFDGGENLSAEALMIDF